MVSARAHTELTSVILVHLPLAGKLDSLPGGKPRNSTDRRVYGALGIPQAEHGVRGVLAFVHHVLHFSVELMLGERGVSGSGAEFVRHDRPRV